MTTEGFIDLFERAGIEDIRDDYSGRGFAGTTCLGFIVPRHKTETALVAQVMAQAVYSAADLDEATNAICDLEALFVGAKTDNMGLDTIVYFPRVKTSK